MSHWAEVKEIDGKLIVQRVVVGNSNVPDEGYSWVTNNLGGTWLKTSYNADVNGYRKNYAKNGYEYREDLDAFVGPSPFPSWVLGEDAKWHAPTEKPIREGYEYAWDEESISWNEIALPEKPDAPVLPPNNN